jgi:thiosulfate/3-mercaptopyruvate sulfurtransferase
LTLLITASELDDLIHSDDTVRILDVRWRLDRPDGRDEYAAGHIPGAIYVDLDSELAAHGEPVEGRHPLPPVDEFQAAARRWGINDGDTVVVYDNFKNLSAARAWWLLTYAGVHDVRVLDGSLRAWTTAGLPLETGEASAAPGSIDLEYGHLPVLSIDDVATFPENGVLLDVRAPERYRGDEEPIDPKAGHIPGAVNAPAIENVDENGKFLHPDALAARFSALGVSDETPVATYCGSGINAAHTALALAIAGHTPALYAGSWSQWSNSDLPVATGSAPPESESLSAN